MAEKRVKGPYLELEFPIKISFLPPTSTTTTTSMTCIIQKFLRDITYLSSISGINGNWIIYHEKKTGQWNIIAYTE
jgi:hypothetical protein